MRRRLSRWPHLTGFAPIYDENARVLIVGTMPSAASLAAAEYYAHKRNAFWPMMAQILGEPIGQDYGARCAMLLWRRKGCR